MTTKISVLIREEGSYSDHVENILCAAVDEERFLPIAHKDIIEQLQWSLSWGSKPKKTQELLETVKNTQFTSIDSLNKSLKDSDVHNLPWYTVAQTDLVDG